MLQSGCNSRIIAPGGSLEHVRAAVEEGAHGVYVGPRLMSGRSGYAEMDMDSIREARRITRASGVELYAAVNRSIPPGEKDMWQKSLEEIASIGPDALIIGSFCVLTLVRQMGLSIPLHASTFMGIYNAPAAEFVRDRGFSRIILNTGLFVDEMQDIIQRVPQVDYELIAYGGICLNDNHRCNLPHGLRQAPQGDFTGTRSRESTFCQLRLVMKDREGNPASRGRLMCYPVIDLSARLGIFTAMGISHFKIAGRERTPEFVRQAVRRLREGLERIDGREGQLAYILPMKGGVGRDEV